MDMIACNGGGWNEAKKSYDNIWKFQIEWVAKLPWVEGLMLVMEQVHCVVVKQIGKWVK
jgi:hypothetical protein